MACNPTPLSCLNPSNIFAGVYNPNCGGFADPSKHQAEQVIYRSAFLQLINNYGVDVNYYVNGFNVSEMNMLYGEHTTQIYSDPIVVKAYLELEESVSLSQFGMQSDDTLTMYIAIEDFTNKFATAVLSGYRVEPKSDDLVEITALACDRPGDRGAKIFRITEVLDQNTSGGLNPLMGHYVWAFKAKRYETSHETNAPMEMGDDQVYDNLFSGKESSTLYPTLTSDVKLYTSDVDIVSKETIYDMDNTDNNVYGDYY